VTTFDPDTGKLLDPEALRSIQVNAAGFRKPATFVDRADRKHTEHIHADDGSTAGWQIDHKSGRVDGNATPKAVNASAGME
jgi:hypothetical protein